MNYWVLVTILIIIIFLLYIQYFRVIRIILLDSEKNLCHEIEKRNIIKECKIIKIKNSNNSYKIITNTGYLKVDEKEGLFKIIWYRFNFIELIVFKNDKFLTKEEIDTRYRKVKVIRILNKI